MNISVSVSMSKVSGDNQQAQVSTALSQPFVIKVSYINGTGVPNITINLAITQQPQAATGAGLSATQVTTDASGQAQVRLTLGNKSGQYQVSASNPNVSNSSVVFTATAIGGAEPGEYLKDENPDLPIRDYQTIVSTLNIPDSIKISEVEVYVNITHTYIGDLVVTLISPSGKQHILHNRSRRAANIIQWYKGIAAFCQDDTSGNWQLKVEDKASGDKGTLNLWKIKITRDTGEAWTTWNCIRESKHEYDNNFTNTWVITHPGASEMRVHFEKYSIEGDNYPYDKLYILDKNSNEVCWYSGYNKKDIWSPVVSGDTIRLKLVTDYNVPAYGFKVDKYMAVGGSSLPQDTISPAQITNLSASDATENSIKLIWTAPGDDASSGQATSYDIRYSTSPINDTNWVNASQVVNEPAPAAAGTSQNMVISGLQMNTLYYVGIKTSDEVSNTSPLSNIASLRTKGPVDIQVGSQATGSLANKDYIWYRLYLASQTQIKIILSSDSTVDYDLRIYSGNADSWSSSMAISSLGRGQVDKCEIDNSGYIWIKVSHNDGSGNYTLKLQEKWQMPAVWPPQGWVTTNNVVESPHNYTDNYDNTWTITQPNASTMTVHFSRFETESGYDYLYIYDGNNNLIEIYDGYYYSDIWTPPVPGNTVKIRLITNKRTTEWGFKMDRYAWRTTTDCPLIIEKVIITHTPFSPSAAISQTLTITPLLKCRMANTGNPAKDFRYFTTGTAGTYTIWDGKTYHANNQDFTGHGTSYWIEMLNAAQIRAYQWDTAWGTLTYNWTSLRCPTNMNVNNWIGQNQVRFSNPGTYVFRVNVTHTRNKETIQMISSHSHVDIVKSRPSTIPSGDIENIQDVYMVHLKGTQTDAYAWAESFLTVLYNWDSPYPVDYHGIDCAGLIHAANWLAGTRYYKHLADTYLTNNTLSTALGGINPQQGIGAQRNDWMGVDRKVNGGFDGTWGHIVLLRNYRYDTTEPKVELRHKVDFIHARGSTGVEEIVPPRPNPYPGTDWNLIFRRPR